MKEEFISVSKFLYKKFIYEYKLLNNNKIKDGIILSSTAFLNRHSYMIFEPNHYRSYYFFEQSFHPSMLECINENEGKYCIITCDTNHEEFIQINNIDDICNYWASKFNTFNKQMYIKEENIYQCIYNTPVIEDTHNDVQKLGLYYWLAIWMRSQNLNKFIYAIKKSFNAIKPSRRIIRALLQSVDIGDSFYFWFAVYGQHHDI